MDPSRARLSGQTHGDVVGRRARVGSLCPRAGSAVALRCSPLPAIDRLYGLRGWSRVINHAETREDGRMRRGGQRWHCAGTGA
jgi:hypothetical protein